MAMTPSTQVALRRAEDDKRPGHFLNRRAYSAQAKVAAEIGMS